MRLLHVLTAVLLMGCSGALRPAPPSTDAAPSAEAPANAAGEVFPSHFTIVRTREFGYWRYRSCTLSINLFMNVNQATLECQPTNEGSPKRASQELSGGVVTRLRQLAHAADFYGPEHIGQDLTATDGRLETLRFRPVAGGRAVVLVTSGNESFARSGARRDLLKLLVELETSLSSKAGLNSW